jgi:DNA-binding FadR family transcriptional regulator
MQFDKLSSPTLKDLFVQQLQRKILSGEIPVGTPIPSERELAEQMQVSRAVINNGIKELASQGFLEVHPRSGTIVSDYRRNGNINTLITIMEYQGGQLGRDEIQSILELRRGLEHLAVQHAILYASDEDLETLSSILSKLALSKTYTEAAQNAFHFQHELAFIGKNSILPLIYSSFKAPVITLWERYCKLYGFEKLCCNTEILYKHVCSRNMEQASKWIDSYLENVIRGNEQIYYNLK